MTTDITSVGRLVFTGKENFKSYAYVKCPADDWLATNKEFKAKAAKAPPPHRTAPLNFSVTAPHF